jgi:hypothetical protein
LEYWLDILRYWQTKFVSDSLFGLPTWFGAGIATALRSFSSQLPAM